MDKYQGQQKDFIILSLVRTKRVGHIRGVRQLVVVLSRARLGFNLTLTYSDNIIYLYF